MCHIQFFIHSSFCDVPIFFSLQKTSTNTRGENRCDRHRLLAISSLVWFVCFSTFFKVKRRNIQNNFRNWFMLVNMLKSSQNIQINHKKNLVQCQKSAGKNSTARTCAASLKSGQFHLGAEMKIFSEWFTQSECRSRCVWGRSGFTDEIAKWHSSSYISLQLNRRRRGSFSLSPSSVNYLI